MVHFEGFLRQADHDFALCSPLNLHCILAGNHDFSAPIDFAVFSPPTKSTVPLFLGKRQ